MTKLDLLHIVIFTPKDFDYSPYFEIIKYPIYGFDHIAMYKKLPWDKDGIMCHAPGDCFLPDNVSASTTYPEGKLQHKINLLRFQGKHSKNFSFKRLISNKNRLFSLWDKVIYSYFNPVLKSNVIKNTTLHLLS